jgi:glycosyltransferase involved in cell wall biosynthesis
MNEVDVSVVVANFNNSIYLKDFFNSITTSSAYPKEIIFVDDCSTDDSIKIVNSLNVENLKLICLDKNVGFSNALNIGIENSICKYILRVDPDDFIDSERIKKQFIFLEDHPQIDVLGSNCKYYNDSLNKIVGISKVKLDHSEIIMRYRNGEHGMIHGTILCKSHILKEIKYKQENYPAEEYDIFSRMILRGLVFHNLEATLLTYRIHGRSVSNKTPFSTVKKIFELNEVYFKKNNSSFKIFRMFLFFRNYRNYLETNVLYKKVFYLIISIIFKPESVFYRISALTSKMNLSTNKLRHEKQTIKLK